MDSDTARAAALDDEAAMLEAFADDRYERAARWYRGGTRTFVESLDTADEYRKEAAAKRRQAAELRQRAQRQSRNETMPRAITLGFDPARFPNMVMKER